MDMNKTKIAVLVSGGGTNLQALIDAEQRGELGNGVISLVIASKPDVYALERAKKHGIASKVLARKEYDSIASYSKALADAMEAENIDLVVLAGFLTIIDEQVYERFPNRILNVHPALIPSFCGMGYYGIHVHEKAIEYGVKLSGATVHFVEADVDGGAIIMQRAVPVEPNDTPESLQARILKEEHKMLPECVKLLCQGKVRKVGRKVYID